ncbi:MAG TPA: cytochrome P450 [Herpetosiphonaceae bacterium]
MTHAAPAIAAPDAPGPRGRLLLGSLPEFTGDLLATMADDFPRYGDLIRYRVGPRTVYVLSHPELAQEVLVRRQREFPKAGGSGGLGVVVGKGLIANPDPDSWLAQRRMMQPMFHHKRLAAMGDKMTAAGERMLGRWAARPAGAPLDMSVEMMEVTLDIIMQTMFSADVLSEVGRIAPAVAVATEYANHRIFNPLSAPAAWPTRRNRAFAKAKATLDEIIFGLIRERRAMAERPGDLLDMLLDARDADTDEQMSDQQIRDEVLTIFAAGHETTAGTLAFACYALSQHPAALARLHEESDRVLGGRLPTVDDLPNLPYAQQVFREAMRLYPAAPIAGPRRALADTDLGGFRIPAGARLIVSIANIHRHPALWREPERFDPDRFAQGAAEARHPLAFMPFGAGPRKCIGNNLAEMEGTLLLALVAGRHGLELLPGHEVRPRLAITLRAATGIPMILRRRALSNSAD